MTAFRRCHRGLKNLPDNLDVTLRLCNRYCGYLVFDGKYINVKGYERVAVLLWGIDFLTHDPLHFTLAPSENYLACRNYFASLRRINYPLQYLVCDDNDAIKMAARFIYPKVIIQTCLNHYLENIRRDLNIRSRPDYQDLRKSSCFLSSLRPRAKRGGKQSLFRLPRSPPTGGSLAMTACCNCEQLRAYVPFDIS